MFRIGFGIFIILHGLVHLLYFGQSARYFQLQPGMEWPDGSLIFSRLVGDAAARNLASSLLVLAATGLVASGVGIVFQQSWWRPLVIGAVIFSSALFAAFWDGGLQHLDNKGAIGILINLAILAVLLWAKWPQLDF